MSQIINGKYYPDGYNLPSARVNSQQKTWDHDDQRQRFAKDIIQAHKNGKPNPDFIREYPEAATQYFTPDQIREFGNQY